MIPSFREFTRFLSSHSTKAGEGQDDAHGTQMPQDAECMRRFLAHIAQHIAPLDLGNTHMLVTGVLGHMRRVEQSLGNMSAQRNGDGMHHLESGKLGSKLLVVVIKPFEDLLFTVPGDAFRRLKHRFFLLPDLGHHRAHAGIASNEAHERDLLLIKGDGGDLDNLAVLFYGAHKASRIDGPYRDRASEKRSGERKMRCIDQWSKHGCILSMLYM